MLSKVNFNRASITWTVKEMLSLYEENRLFFNNAVQRGIAWDEARSSLLIDSILLGYEIPPMYAKKGNGNTYDMLDGKQRCNAIISYTKGDFALTEMSPELEDYDGKYFDDLEEEDQDIILSYSLKVTYFDGITDNEVREAFYRLNNGKPLTSFEQSRARAKALPAIQEICQSDLFNSEKTGKALPSYKREELAFKMWMILHVDSPSLDAKSLNRLLPVTEIKDEEKTEMLEICDTIFSIAEAIKEDKEIENTKLRMKIYKRIVTPTHMLSLTPIIKRALDEERSLRKLTSWLEHFYSGKKRASIDEVYNANASRGSAHACAVKARLGSLESSYNNFMKAKSEDTAITE